MAKFKNFINESYNPKYPRTYHMPWSEEVHSDDKISSNIEGLIGKTLTITVKMDGSNVGLSFETVSSRSGMSPSHPSFDMLKQKYATVKYDIPKGMVIYGEWLYAVHSIEYDNLDDYLNIFAIREGNKWYSWKDVETWAGLLGIPIVPVVKKNITFKSIEEMEKVTTQLAKKVISSGHEGIVMRLSGSFTDFEKSTAKYVRRGHVQTDKHWKHQKIRVNKVK